VIALLIPMMACCKSLIRILSKQPLLQPGSQSHLCSQVDSSAATAIPTNNAREVPKRKGRQLGSKNKKTLQREATIGSAMQAGGTQAQRDEALQALQAARQGARPASWFKGKGFKKEGGFIGHQT
jgi:hypothetical protein